MRVTGVAMAVAAALFAATPAGASETVVGPRPRAVEDRWILEPPGIRVETWASGLTAPWSLAFLPDGRALVSERRGRILLIEHDGGLLPFGRVEIHEDDESGLMGLAIHPTFPDPPFVYAMYTWRGDGRFENQVARFRVGNDGLTDGQGIRASIPAGDNHNGGRIAFGPDGAL
jgi:quinoprotein glucose dehydrogenase